MELFNGGDLEHALTSRSGVVGINNEGQGLLKPRKGPRPIDFHRYQPTSGTVSVNLLGACAACRASVLCNCIKKSEKLPGLWHSGPLATFKYS